jgi:hypothetical protein
LLSYISVLKWGSNEVRGCILHTSIMGEEVLTIAGTWIARRFMVFLDYKHQIDFPQVAKVGRYG